MRKLRAERGVPDDRRSGVILTLIGPPGTGKTSIGESIARATGPEVRPHVARRRARRGRDPRPPPHLHRRAAGPAGARAARRRHHEPGHHARRGRQGRRRLARRSVVGAARGARPGAEPLLPRPLPRRRARPLARALHRHGQRGRHHPRPAARPHGGHPLRRLHDRRRRSRSRAATSGRGRWSATASGPTRSTIDDDVLRTVVTDYTREAGVRQLERELGTLLRKTATAHRVGRGRRRRSRSTSRAVREALGRQKFFQEAAVRTAVPGVATGLAVTGTGGDVLFVEAAAMPGTRRAGPHRPARRRHEGVGAHRAHLGAAATPAELGIDEPAFDGREFHLHVPAGAIPKDGPSAGRHDGDGARVAAHGAAGEAHRRHDRRGDARRVACCRSAASSRRCWRRTPPA